MRKSPVFLVVFALVLISFSTALAAAQPLIAKPWVYDPEELGVSAAHWVTGVGLPDAGKSNHALYLAKQAETPANTAGGADIGFQGTLTELGFDYHNEGYCGAGAPRINVYTTSGTYFFGCIYGTHTPAPDDPDNWTRVRFDVSGLENEQVTGMDVVFDEGPGEAYLDNIDINGTLIGKPGNAK